jgi:NAD(P)-dependent dehydrogenase (short-subunit alcohol dehydrogenase family)
MILVIGGTSGIGYATAKYLQENNYDVIICGRNKPKESSLKYLYVNLLNEKSIQNLFNSIESLSGIIYSAGITTKQKSIIEFDQNLWQNIMDVNVTGLLLCLKYCYLHLKASQGKVIVVNSVASRTYSKYSGVEYTISKSALSGLVKQLSIEFAKDKVLINSIFPSMTVTSMLINNVKKEVLENIEDDIPLKRLLEPLEIAKTIEFLISKNNTYITGTGIDINGGQFLNG